MITAEHRLSEQGLSRRSRQSLASIAQDTLPPPVRFNSLRMPEEQLAKIQNKRLKEFYMHQNAMIDRFMEVDQVLDFLQREMDPRSYGTTLAPSHRSSSPSSAPSGMVTDEEEQIETNGASAENEPLIRPQLRSKNTPKWIVQLAINLSFVVNIVMFVTKLFLAFYSGSMSILASAFESFLDVLSNAIIYFTIRIIRKKDHYAYPVGKSRMEPLGIIVFAVIITTSFSQVLITSIERLTDPSKASEELDLSPLALALLISNIVLKGILWIWCLTIRGSSSVQALAQDHGNDVVFNIASTIFPVIAVSAGAPWLDPVGAILLSIYIIQEWMVVLLENIRRLTGQAASVDDVKQLTYMAYRFSTKIEAVDTVRAYYIGDRLLVEVDIVLPPECPLQEAHDIGEALQNALEMMENVERAFVHLDYTAEHEIEHRRVVEGVGFGH
ncbi:cation efflux family-domain-containing protein [Radiomyces spectabilis]|uniref:cation efflux family-domain-containing protein n=1 Tax=Radiomyces spectabilis TaxID=64574 RepID=UPI00221EED10|nr:cation efflux family-domain-containing protein [Radiomyces spectabilis]KAI8394106.1 cation efflux family-domain-containing protein [Radiomyces spectabilis]